MPWKEDGPMELRAELIREWKEGESVTALAEAYGVSRKTIYKWLGRHESEGTAGLADRSRAPHNSPLKVSAEMIAHIIETRQHWGWGPRKLLVKMAEAWPEEKIPSASTVAEVLRGKGRSEEHTSELQSLRHLVCRLLLEKKKNQITTYDREIFDVAFRLGLTDRWVT